MVSRCCRLGGFIAGLPKCGIVHVVVVFVERVELPEWLLNLCFAAFGALTILHTPRNTVPCARAERFARKLTSVWERTALAWVMGVPRWQTSYL
jgi:hypothetical protein